MPKKSIKRYQVIPEKRYTFSGKGSEDAFHAKYNWLLSLAQDGGNSGQFDTKTGRGSISSFAEEIARLEKEGFKRINFGNGGDDDVLVVDTLRREYATFEDYMPERLSKDPHFAGMSLEELDKEQMELERKRMVSPDLD